MKKINTITIFVIQAYEELDKNTQTVKDLCTLDIIEDTADEAIARAKQLIKKKFYRISSIIEKEMPMSELYQLPKSKWHK